MPVTIRPATAADLYATFQVFQAAILDLSQRQGVMSVTGGDDPAVLAGLWQWQWQRRRPLWEHLAKTAAHSYVAEHDGEIVGYARTIVRDGVQELTEFFVRPGQQSGGLGRDLLARAFPLEGARHKVIVATTDVRAQARYLKTGVYPRFPIQYFSRRPEIRAAAGISAEPISAMSESLAALDLAVLGHRREVDHAFLLTERKGFLYQRGGRPVGYGYVGYSSGPFALLDERDFPAVLAHAESEAAAQGLEEFGVEVPMINRAAVDYLLARRYRIDPFVALFMSDVPLGKFENYLCTSPPFFL